LKSLELKVPMICLIIGCVSLRRERRYKLSPFYALHDLNQLVMVFYANYLSGPAHVENCNCYKDRSIKDKQRKGKRLNCCKG